MLRALRQHLLPSIALTAVVAVVVGLAYPIVVWGIGQVAFKNQANGSLLYRDGKVVGSALIGQSFTSKTGTPLPQYFQSRPSGTGTYAYNSTDSAASNYGPSDPRLVGFIPGFNTVGLNGEPSATNPFATKADPYCVPLTKSTGKPVISPEPGEKYEKTKTGSYVCDPTTVPERAMAYRKLNGLAPDAKVPVDAVTTSASGLDAGISIANADLQAPRVAKARHLPLRTVLALVRKYTIGSTWGFLGTPYVNVLELNLALENMRR